MNNLSENQKNALVAYVEGFNCGFQHFKSNIAYFCGVFIMKKWTFQRIVLATSMALAVCHASNVFSHQLNNSLTAADAVDHFLVTCGEAGNHHLFVQIDDLRVVDGRQFNALVIKDKAVSSITNPDGKSSPVIRVEGGMGVYQVYVSQTAGGDKAANYQLMFHCEDIDNAHFETSVFTKIDQP